MIGTSMIRVVAVVAGIAACTASAAAGPVQTTPWQLRLTWGQTIPGGDKYTVTLDDTGALKAEREGFTAGEPTVVRHEGTLPADTIAAIRSAAATLDRRFDPKKARGSMLGDGGFMRLELQEGTETSTMGVGRLSSRSEAGKDWLALVSAIEKTLPDGFVR
jgi:hypothetical protein